MAERSSLRPQPSPGTGSIRHLFSGTRRSASSETAEPGGAGEGRPAGVGVGHYAVYEVEIDERGAAEIEVGVSPETAARRIGGLMIFGPVITQMPGQGRGVDSLEAAWTSC